MNNEIKSKNPVDVKILTRFLRDGLLNKKAYEEAVKLIRPALFWQDLSRKLLLFLGAALILSGIIFFFAYNWAKMGKFLKFGLIESGIALSIVFTIYFNPDNIKGKLSLLSASVLVGVFLAVFGQNYQTGADAYSLFSGWAMLIAVWVLVSMFTPMWFLLLFLINLGISLYFFQVHTFGPLHTLDTLFLVLSILNLSALILREIFLYKGAEFLSGKWFRYIVILFILAVFTQTLIHSNIKYYDHSLYSQIMYRLSILSFPVGYFVYRFKLPDIHAIALIVSTGCIVLLINIIYIIFEINRFHIETFFYIGITIIGVVAGTVYFLKYTANEMRKAELVSGEDNE